MKSSSIVSLGCLLGLPLLGGAQSAGSVEDTSATTSIGLPVKGLEGRKTGLETASSTPSTTLILTRSTESPTPTPSTILSPELAIFSTTTNTIDISSLVTSSTQYSSNTTPNSVAIAISTNAPANSTISASSSQKSSMSHRTLVIILSSVLGSVGVLLIAGALFLANRCGRGRRPFSKRSVSPLDDDEIDSWRGTVMEQKRPPMDADPTILIRQGNAIQMAPSPGWTWTTSPTSLRSAPSPSMIVPTTPAFVAKAPNSRAGLTDETVRGADPFIPPIKRQTSRLSKAHPGHGRSKSSRSSVSGKSSWSDNGAIGSNDKTPIWFDPEQHDSGPPLSRIEGTRSNSPAMSTFDNVGGLSPRPKSQPRVWNSEIGRAVG